MNSRAGLSLLELLLALALLAVIGASLVSSVGLGIRLSDRVTVLSEQHEPLAARRLLRSLLNTALPPERIVPFDHAFLGQADSFSFVTLNGRNIAPTAAALRVTVRREPEALILTIAALMDGGDEKVVLELPLARETTFEAFNYYDPQTEPGNWTTSWEDADKLPGLIRIDATRGNELRWPEFSVAPSLSN
jgi:hypothetical protein